MSCTVVSYNWSMHSISVKQLIIKTHGSQLHDQGITRMQLSAYRATMVGNINFHHCVKLKAVIWNQLATYARAL